MTSEEKQNETKYNTKQQKGVERISLNSVKIVGRLYQVDKNIAIGGIND